jgi:hypothetical protein
MNIFEADGRLKHRAVLVVFISLLVGSCGLFDHDDKDRSNGGEKGNPCQEAQKNYNACVAERGSPSACVEFHDQVGTLCRQ